MNSPPRKDPYTTLPELGQQVSRWRRAQRMTQAQLEQRAGLAHNAISRIERGEVSPRQETIDRIATALEVGIEELYFRVPPAEIREPSPDEEIADLVERLQSLSEGQRRELLRAFLTILDQIGRKP